MTAIRFVFVLFFTTMVCGLTNCPVEAADATIDHFCQKKVFLITDAGSATYLCMQCENCDGDTNIKIYADGQIWGGHPIDERKVGPGPYCPGPDPHMQDVVKLTYEGMNPSDNAPPNGTVTVKNNGQTPHEKSIKYQVINLPYCVGGCCRVCPPTRCRCGCRCEGSRYEPIRRRCRKWRCR